MWRESWGFPPSYKVNLNKSLGGRMHVHEFIVNALCNVFLFRAHSSIHQNSYMKIRLKSSLYCETIGIHCVTSFISFQQQRSISLVWLLWNEELIWRPCNLILRFRKLVKIVKEERKFAIAKNSLLESVQTFRIHQVETVRFHGRSRSIETVSINDIEALISEPTERCSTGIFSKAR